jgi:hypothetical protein
MNYLLMVFDNKYNAKCCVDLNKRIFAKIFKTDVFLWKTEVFDCCNEDKHTSTIILLIGITDISKLCHEKVHIEI